MAYSDLLATIALIVSLLTAAWTGWRNWRWDRPVISVSGEQWINLGDHTGPKDISGGFSIDIVNRGNQATQITAAFWEIDQGNGLQIRYLAASESVGIESPLENESGDGSPRIPFMLERNQRRAWDFKMGTRGMLDKESTLRCRPVVEFVSRKSTEFAYGDWQPSQITIYARDERLRAEREGISESD